MNENISEQKRRKLPPQRDPGSFGDGYSWWNCSGSKEEALRCRVIKTSTQQMPLPRASVSRPCHGVELLEILARGRHILVSVPGPKALEILAKLGWTGDRQSDGYTSSLDSHLGLVLGARSSAIAFPERSGLTRNTFSPSRVTSAWVPQSRTSRTQILVAGGWSAGPETTSRSPPALLPLESRSGPVRSLLDSHFREVRRIKLPPGNTLPWPVPWSAGADSTTWRG